MAFGNDVRPNDNDNFENNIIEIEKRETIEKEDKENDDKLGKIKEDIHHDACAVAPDVIPHIGRVLQAQGL